MHLPPGLLGFLLEPEAYLAFFGREGATSVPDVQFSPLASLLGVERSSTPDDPALQEVTPGGSQQLRGIIDRLQYAPYRQDSALHPAAAWLKQR